ncbi:MAG: sel1 repeat family protein [Oligoflexia bacterium]|nr:sel1 repeat family protein [Oligoflexia bacterium]
MKTGKSKSFLWKLSLVLFLVLAFVLAAISYAMNVQKGTPSFLSKYFFVLCGQGNCLQLGSLAIKDKKNEDALKYFGKACLGGDMKGCFNFGIVAEILKQNNHARAIFEYSCNQNHYNSCHNLAAYEIRSTNKKEVEQGKKHYEISCEQNKHTIIGNLSCLNLASLYEKSKNYELALKYFAKVCDRGELQGCTNKGIILMEQKKVAAALAVWGKACEEGSNESCGNKATYLFNKKQDEKLGVK